MRCIIILDIQFEKRGALAVVRLARVEATERSAIAVPIYWQQSLAACAQV